MKPVAGDERAEVVAFSQNVGFRGKQSDFLRRYLEYGAWVRFVGQLFHLPEEVFSIRSVDADGFFWGGP